MITTNNYFAEISKINLADLPEALRKTHDLVKQVTDDGASWEKYESSPTIKRVVDLYLQKLNEIAGKQQKQEKEPFLKKGQPVWFYDQGKLVQGEARYEHSDPTGIISLVYHPGGSHVGKIVNKPFKEVYTEKPTATFKEIKDANKDRIIVARPSHGKKEDVPNYKLITDNIKNFIPAAQLEIIGNGMRGEEKDFFRDKLAELDKLISKMPVTYEQAEVPAKDKIVYLHYFTGSANWYIVEKYKGTSGGDGKQHQAFGYADLGHGDGEWGYISIEELRGQKMVELDLHFKPQKFGKVVKTSKESISRGAKAALKAERSKPKADPKKARSGKPEKVSSKAIKSAAKAPKRSEKPQKVSIDQGKPVERLDEEHRIVRRFVGLHEKEKTADQIMNFLDYVQKAILEKRVRKESSLANEVMYIQNELVKIYNKMISGKMHTLKLSLSEQELTKYGNIARSQFAMPSIQLLKRYVSWDGKKITKEKAQKLKDQLDLAMKKGKITRDDPYAEKANQAWKNLRDYIQNYKRGNTLKIYDAELRGVWDVLRKAGHGAMYVAKKAAPHVKRAAAASGKFLKEKALPAARRAAAATHKFANDKVAPRVKHAAKKVHEKLKSELAKEKAAKVMREFHKHKLYSSGSLVTDVQQAKAIAMSEAHKIDADLGEAELSGFIENLIVGIAAGGAAGAAQAVTAKKLKSLNGVMSIAEAKAATYKTIGLSGKWKALIGEACLPTYLFVYGPGGSGKSSMIMQLADYLSENHPLLYVAGEQYGTPTFSKMLNSLNISGNENFMIVKDLKTLNPKDFAFVVLDSKDSLGIDIDTFRDLKLKNPNTSFILTSQSTKLGNFTGGGNWQNEVDTMIRCEDGVATTVDQKNRWGGHADMPIFGNPSAEHIRAAS